MANTSKTIRPVESGRDSFEALKKRFMSLLCRLQTLANVLGDCCNVPIEIQPAAFCFDEPVKEVAQLYEDLDVAGVWDPKAKEVQS